MKALAVYPFTQAVKMIFDHPEPYIQAPDHVKIRMLSVGICGTDQEIVSFHYGTPPKDSEYLVIGHESLGIVAEVGESVRQFSVGDLVVIMVRRPCPHAQCVACTAGRPDFCYSGNFTERGIKERHGFLTEYVIEEEQYLIPIHKSLRDVAVLTEPLTIAEKALQQIREVQDRMPWPVSGQYRIAMVLGAGPVGLLGAMLLRKNGYRTIVYSREPDTSDRAAILMKIGIEYVSSEKVTIPDLARNVGHPDVVYEATGAAGISFELLEQLDVNGIFIFTGVPGRKKMLELNASKIMSNIVLKNQIILGTVNAGKDSYIQAAADLGEFYNAWPEATRGLITGHHALQDFSSALARSGIKNVIDL